MLATGGQQMVARLMPQVMTLLQGSDGKQNSYDFDPNEDWKGSKEVRTEAYKLLIEMTTFFPVIFPLAMLVQDVTETDSPDFKLMNQAFLAIFHLPI